MFKNFNILLNMSRVSLFSLLVFSFICNSCISIDGHQSIRFTNNSDRDIYVYGSVQYTDTLFFSWNVVFHNSGYLVPARSTCDCLELRYNSTWEYAINTTPSDTMIVFFIDADSLTRVCTDQTIDWSKFDVSTDLLPYNERMVLRRDYYTLDDLDKMDWTITYP